MELLWNQLDLNLVLMTGYSQQQYSSALTETSNAQREEAWWVSVSLGEAKPLCQQHRRDVAFFRTDHKSRECGTNSSLAPFRTRTHRNFQRATVNRETFPLLQPLQDDHTRQPPTTRQPKWVEDVSNTSIRSPPMVSLESTTGLARSERHLLLRTCSVPLAAFAIFG